MVQLSHNFYNKISSDPHFDLKVNSVKSSRPTNMLNLQMVLEKPKS